MITEKLMTTLASVPELSVITLLAMGLLAVRVVAVWLFLRVLKAQRGLMGRPIPDHIIRFRRNLHWLTIALTLSNIPAIVLDVFFILNGVGLALLVVSSTMMLSLYTIANAVSALIAAVLIHKIYKDALEVDRTTEGSDHTLMNNE